MDCLRPWRAFRSRSNQLRFEVNAALLCRTSSAHAGLYNTRRRHKKKKKHKNKKKGKREKVTMRCQLEFRSRSHLIAKLSTIRQLTSKISCKLSIKETTTGRPLCYFWTTQKAEYDQLIKLRGQTNFRPCQKLSLSSVNLPIYPME